MSQAGTNGTSGGGGGSGFTSINTQVFTTDGTYLPTAQMKYCIIECVGGGGGGGDADAGGGGVASAGGGGGGGYSRKVCSAATIGASQPIVIGVGGDSQISGGDGGTSSVGSLIQATGGDGGLDQSPVSAGFATAGGLGGVGSLGDINMNGSPGGAGFGIFIGGVTAYSISGVGGASYFGGGGIQSTQNSSGAFPGSNGLTAGAGGSGGCTLSSGVGAQGGLGQAGIVVITEYI